MLQSSFMQQIGAAELAAHIGREAKGGSLNTLQLQNGVDAEVTSGMSDSGMSGMNPPAV